MNFFRTSAWQKIIFVLLTAVSAVSLHAQDALLSLAERYPPGSIDTTERANAALSEIAAARSAVDTLYGEQRVACFGRFFSSSCLTDVRKRQRSAQTTIRKIEVESNAVLRREKAAERDRALAERDKRAEQQPGSRSSPISGSAREPAPAPAAEIPTFPESSVDGKP